MEELVEIMDFRCLKVYLSKKRSSPFCILPKMMIIDSILISFPMFLFFCLVMNIINGRGIWLIPLLFVSVFLCFVLLIAVFLKQSVQLRKEKKDIAEHQMIVVDAILVSSCSLSRKQMFFLPNLIGCLFWQHAMVYQKVTYKPLNGDQSLNDYFYDLISLEKVQLLRQLFDVDATFWGLDIWLKEAFFKKELPVKLVIGKESKMLQQVLPIENYEYTVEQLTALNNLSQRYYRNEEPSVCKNKVNMLDFFTKKCIKSVEQKKTLPSKYILWRIFLLSITKPLWLIAFLILIYDVICFNEIYWLVLILLVVNFYFSKRISFAKFMPLTRFRIDKRNGNIKIMDVILKSSVNPEKLNPTEILAGEIPIGDFDDLGIIFKEEKASIQRCYYWKIGRYVNGEKYCNMTDNFHMILTKDKLAALRSVYKNTPEIFATQEMMPCFQYELDVPLRITIGETCRELYRIDPVEGYRYTKEQLVAIEKFNTLYP